MSQTGLIKKDSLNKESKSVKIIDNFCGKIVLEKEINHDEIGKLLELLNVDPDFPSLLVDKIIMLQKQNMSLKLLNYENLHHFASILNTITLNIELNENKSEYEINFAIIYIAERTFYSNSSYVKTYLCSIISRNNIYSSKKFWMDLMYLKIYKKIDQIMFTAQESNKIISPRDSFSLVSPMSSFSAFTETKSSTLSTASIVNNTGLFSNIGKFMNYFSKNSGVSELSETMQKKVEKAKGHEITLIIKEFIPHFSNFNFEISEAIDIIVELASTFNLPKEKISYFISIINSNIFTVKNKSKLESNTNSTHNRKYSSLSNNKNLFETRLKLVTHSLDFLPLGKDYLSLLQINKKFYAEISRKMYKKILLDSPNIKNKKRFEVWRSILKYVSSLYYIFNFYYIII